MSLHFPLGYRWLFGLLMDRESLDWAPMVKKPYKGLTICIASIWATAMFRVWVGWLVFGHLALNPSLVASSGMLPRKRRMFIVGGNSRGVARLPVNRHLARRRGARYEPFPQPIR